MTTKLRPEVEAEISEAASDCTDALFSRNADDVEATALRPTLLALVELGVRLGVSRCADALMICGKKSDNAILAAMCWGLAAEFRAAKPADILQAQPGEETTDE